MSTLQAGGCERVLVVVGADGAAAAAAARHAGAQPVVADDWASGQAASLRAGLAALAELPPAVGAAVIALVDQPLVPPALVRRLLERAQTAPAVAVRADGVLSPPVVLHRSVWEEVRSAVSGDRGAGPWLAANRDRVLAVDVGDVADLVDVDDPEVLSRLRSQLDG